MSYSRFLSLLPHPSDDVVRTVALESNHCNFLCPISYDIMKDPVQTADGQ